MRARREGETSIEFRCPGCVDLHYVHITPTGWTFNGDFDSPTLSPSVLVKNGHFLDTFKPGDSCWCTYDAAHPDQPSGFSCRRCHSFVKDGTIQFLGDCSHALAGQTVELPELE